MWFKKVLFVIIICLLAVSSCKTTEKINDFYFQERAERIVRSMSDSELVGQVFIISLRRDLNGEILDLNIQGMEPAIETLIQEIKPGGILLFGENLSNIEGTISLNQEMQNLSNYPLFIATDEEGGIVSRLNSVEAIDSISFLSNQEISQNGDSDLAYKKGRIIGLELSGLGINMNLAPIADLYTNEDNIIIGARAYGSDPYIAGGMVAAEVQGLQDENIAAVLKHFPGQGETFIANGRSMVDHNLERLKSTEFRTFSAGIEAGVVGIMVGHISVPEVTGDNLLSTFSPIILNDILRDELGFNGLIISDSMASEGLMDSHDGTKIVEAFKAGIDVLLYPPNPLVARDALLAALDSGDLSREKLEESVVRILKVKHQMGLWDTEIYQEIGRPEDYFGSEEQQKDRESVQTILQDIPG